MRKGWGRGAMLTLLASLCCLTLAAPARADEQLDVGPTPVLNVHLNKGQLTVETWDRPQVLIQSDTPVSIQHLDPAAVDPRIPKQIEISSQKIVTAHGPVSLPAESFVLPPLAGVQHDAVLVRGTGNVTMMIPSSTAMMIAHIRAGHFSLNNYHGVFIAHAHAAGISLNNVSGTGFVESLRGTISATNSSFDRLRMRTATGNMLFTGCTSHQIQATSSYGSIVYDNGDFQPGLARFESEHGNVALGVRGGAQIGAHSNSGRVVSSFHNDAQVQGDPTTKQATVGGGGPVVTATSKNGSVYLYSGSMTDHPRVQQELNGSLRLPVDTLEPQDVAPARQPAHPPPAHTKPPVHAQRPHSQPPVARN